MKKLFVHLTVLMLLLFLSSCTDDSGNINSVNKLSKSGTDEILALHIVDADVISSTSRSSTWSVVLRFSTTNTLGLTKLRATIQDKFGNVIHYVYGMNITFNGPLQTENTYNVTFTLPCQFQASGLYTYWIDWYTSDYQWIDSYWSTYPGNSAGTVYHTKGNPCNKTVRAFDAGNRRTHRSLVCWEPPR